MAQYSALNYLVEGKLFTAQGSTDYLELEYTASMKGRSEQLLRDLQRAKNSVFLRNAGVVSSAFMPISPELSMYVEIARLSEVGPTLRDFDQNRFTIISNRDYLNAIRENKAILRTLLSLNLEKDSVPPSPEIKRYTRLLPNQPGLDLTGKLMNLADSWGPYHSANPLLYSFGEWQELSSDAQRYSYNLAYLLAKAIDLLLSQNQILITYETSEQEPSLFTRLMICEALQFLYGSNRQLSFALNHLSSYNFDIQFLSQAELSAYSRNSKQQSLSFNRLIQGKEGLTTRQEAILQALHMVFDGSPIHETLSAWHRQSQTLSQMNERQIRTSYGISHKSPQVRHQVLNEYIEIARNQAQTLSLKEWYEILDLGIPALATDKADDMSKLLLALLRSKYQKPIFQALHKTEKYSFEALCGFYLEANIEGEADSLYEDLLVIAQSFALPSIDEINKWLHETGMRNLFRQFLEDTATNKLVFQNKKNLFDPILEAWNRGMSTDFKTILSEGSHQLSFSLAHRAIREGYALIVLDIFQLKSDALQSLAQNYRQMLEQNPGLVRSWSEGIWIDFANFMQFAYEDNNLKALETRIYEQWFEVAKDSQREMLAQLVFKELPLSIDKDISKILEKLILRSISQDNQAHQTAIIRDYQALFRGSSLADEGGVYQVLSRQIHTENLNRYFVLLLPILYENKITYPIILNDLERYYQISKKADLLEKKLKTALSLAKGADDYSSYWRLMNKCTGESSSQRDKRNDFLVTLFNHMEQQGNTPQDILDFILNQGDKNNLGEDIKLLLSRETDLVKFIKNVRSEHYAFILGLVLPLILTQKSGQADSLIQYLSTRGELETQLKTLLEYPDTLAALNESNSNTVIRKVFKYLYEEKASAANKDTIRKLAQQRQQEFRSLLSEYLSKELTAQTASNLRQYHDFLLFAKEHLAKSDINLKLLEIPLLGRFVDPVIKKNFEQAYEEQIQKLKADPNSVSEAELNLLLRYFGENASLSRNQLFLTLAENKPEFKERLKKQLHILQALPGKTDTLRKLLSSLELPQKASTSEIPKVNAGEGKTPPAANGRDSKASNKPLSKAKASFETETEDDDDDLTESGNTEKRDEPAPSGYRNLPLNKPRWAFFIIVTLVIVDIFCIGYLLR